MALFNKVFMAFDFNVTKLTYKSGILSRLHKLIENCIPDCYKNTDINRKNYHTMH